MSRIERLLAKPKEYDIGGELITFYPMNIKDLPLIVKMSDETKKAEAIGEMIRKSLKRSVPDITEEEIDNLPFEYLQKVIQAIMEVNNLGEK